MPSDKKILEPRCMPPKNSIEKRMSPAVTNRGTNTLLLDRST